MKSAATKPQPHARPQRWARRERGLAMVEFVVGTPVIFLLLFATCELGNALVQYSELADAARNADRYLAANALLGSTGVVELSANLTTATQNLVVYGNTAGTGAPLLPGLAPGQVTLAVDAYNNVSVAVAYPYESLFGGTIPDFVDSGSIDSGAWVLTVFTSMAAL
jgi:Flp pilus assembly protein TadG